MTSRTALINHPRPANAEPGAQGDPSSSFPTLISPRCFADAKNLILRSLYNPLRTIFRVAKASGIPLAGRLTPLPMGIPCVAVPLVAIWLFRRRSSAQPLASRLVVAVPGGVILLPLARLVRKLRVSFHQHHRKQGFLNAGAPGGLAAHGMSCAPPLVVWVLLAVVPFFTPAAARTAGTDLFVSSSGTSQVMEYNAATGAFGKVFAPGGGLSGPGGLVFGPNGDLFLSSTGTDQVVEYNGATGAFVRLFAQGAGLKVPAGLVFGPNGNLSVLSIRTNQILEYSGTTGAFVKIFAQGRVLS